MQCIAYLPTAPKSRARSLHDAAAQRQQHQGKSDKCCSLRSHNAVDGSAPRHFHQQSLTGLTFMASTGAWHRDWKPSTIPSWRKRERERESICVPSINNSLPRIRAAKWRKSEKEERVSTSSTTQDGFLCTYTAPFYVFMHHLPGKVIGFRGGSPPGSRLFFACKYNHKYLSRRVVYPRPYLLLFFTPTPSLASTFPPPSRPCPHPRSCPPPCLEDRPAAHP